MSKITNEVILEKINSLHQIVDTKLDGINCRLDKLNGQVYKNTEARHKQYIINIIIGTVATTALTIIGSAAISALWD